MSRTLFVFFAAIIGAIAIARGSAADIHGTPYVNPVGNFADNPLVRVVKIGPGTKYINAEHFELLVIQNLKGQRFAWRFDTAYAPTGFPLRQIAPAGFEAGSTWVYVQHGPRHVASD